MRRKTAKPSPRNAVAAPLQYPPPDALSALVFEIDKVAPGLTELEVAKVVIRRGFAIVRLLQDSQRTSPAATIDDLAARVLLVRGSMRR